MFQGAKNLDGAFGALADLIPPHAFVNLTSRLAQAPRPLPPAARNQRSQTALLKHTYTALDPLTPRRARLGIWSYTAACLMRPRFWHKKIGTLRGLSVIGTLRGLLVPN